MYTIKDGWDDDLHEDDDDLSETPASNPTNNMSVIDLKANASNLSMPHTSSRSLGTFASGTQSWLLGSIDGFDSEDDSVIESSGKLPAQSSQQSGWSQEDHLMFADDIKEEKSVVKAHLQRATEKVATKLGLEEGTTFGKTRGVEKTVEKQIVSPLLSQTGCDQDDHSEDNFGWEDDSDIFFDDNEEIPDQPQKEAATAAPPDKNLLRIPVKPAGWDHEDNNMLEFDDKQPAEPFDQAGLEPVSQKENVRGGASLNHQPTADGWEDDFFIDDTEDVQSDGLSKPETPPPTHQSSRLLTDLEIYLDQLGHLTQSINAVMQYEYNTTEKALELIKYYIERPGLTEYTIQKELPRMEYRVVAASGMAKGQVTVNKDEIARILQSDQTLMSRCANQSLLADLLHIFTGPDMLVRPQYLGTAVARMCRFHLDYSSFVVQASALLDLSLPTEHGRWKVADIDVRITFGTDPSQPFVDYHLGAIRPTTRDESWESSLRSAANMLSSLSPHERDMAIASSALPDQDFRDLFLQQSQNLIQNSAVGMKSAWQDIESVTGISSKLKQFPAFLPDDVIQAAEQQPLSPKERPTSILGGIVRTGLSKLAKSVTLPDEDPSLYQDWKAQHSKPPPAPAAPLLYHKTDDTRLHSEATPSASPQVLPMEIPLQSDSVPPPPPQRISRIAPVCKRAPTHLDAQPEVSTEVEKPTPPQPSPPTSSDRPLSARSSFPPPNSSEVVEFEHQYPVAKDIIDDGLEDEATSSAVANEHTPEGVNQSLQGRSPEHICVQTLPEGWVYNPEDDIIPTRKRWVNPRPGMRDLRQISV